MALRACQMAARCAFESEGCQLQALSAVAAFGVGRWDTEAEGGPSRVPAGGLHGSVKHPSSRSVHALQACAYVRLPACSRARTQELRVAGDRQQAAGGVAAQFLRSMQRRLLEAGCVPRMREGRCAVQHGELSGAGVLQLAGCSLP